MVPHNLPQALATERDAGWIQPFAARIRRLTVEKNYGSGSALSAFIHGKTLAPLLPQGGPARRKKTEAPDGYRRFGLAVLATIKSGQLNGASVKTYRIKVTVPLSKTTLPV